MDEAAVVKYIRETFAGVETSEAWGCTFFFYDSERKFPFATLANTDENDQFSDLNRPSVFRLNVGVSKATFQSLFGSHSEDGYDFTAFDRIMPHPVYGKMYWVCVLNPGAETFASVTPLLAEAYEQSVKRHAQPRPASES